MYKTHIHRYIPYCPLMVVTCTNIVCNSSLSCLFCRKMSHWWFLPQPLRLVAVEELMLMASSSMCIFCGKRPIMNNSESEWILIPIGETNYYHRSLKRGGGWNTSNYFATNVLHVPLFCTVQWAYKLQTCPFHMVVFPPLLEAYLSASPSVKWFWSHKYLLEITLIFAIVISGLVVGWCWK